MSGVKSSRAVKLSQSRLHLANILIKRKEENTRIKLKTVYKLDRTTGRHWWLSIDNTYLIKQIPKIKIEYFKLRNNIRKTRATYHEEKAKEAAQLGNLQE